MTILLNLAIVLGLAVFMEFVAWATHKYVMHGVLWKLHEDHHMPRGRGLQKNDLFAVFFAAVSMVLLFFGVDRGWLPLISAGIGVALYGLGYSLFHDVMFHKRIPGFRLPVRGEYLERIVAAHSVHHRTTGKPGRDPYSFLYAGPEYRPE